MGLKTDNMVLWRDSVSLLSTMSEIINSKVLDDKTKIKLIKENL